MSNEMRDLWERGRLMQPVYCRPCGLWLFNGFCLHGTVAELNAARDR